MKKWMVAYMAATTALLIVFTGLWLTGYLPNSTQTNRAALGPVASAFREAGMETCLPVANRVATNLTRTSRAGAYVFAEAGNAENTMSSASLEIEEAPDRTVYASMHIQRTGDECAALFETVAYWPMSCERVQQDLVRVQQNATPLLRQIGILDMGANTRLFLMTAGSGCISIRKEIEYKAGPATLDPPA